MRFIQSRLYLFLPPDALRPILFLGPFFVILGHSEAKIREPLDKEIPCLGILASSMRMTKERKKERKTEKRIKEARGKEQE